MQESGTRETRCGIGRRSKPICATGVIPDREDFTLLFDPKKHEWVSARARPAKTLLRFQIPPELLPLQVTHATLVVDISAPGRQLQILAGSGQHQVLATHTNPVGKLRIEIDDREALQTDPNGGIYLGNCDWRHGATWRRE